MVRSVSLALSIAAILVVAAAGTVAADSGGSPDSGAILGPLDVGTCEGIAWPDQDAITIYRTDAEPQFPNGATLRLSQVSISPSPYATLAISIDDDEVVLPADWRDRPVPDGPDAESVSSLPDQWRFSYVVTGVSAGTDEITLTWGIGVNDGPITPYPVTVRVTVSPPCPDQYPDAYPTPVPDASSAPAATLPATDTAAVVAADREAGAIAPGALLVAVGVLGLLSGHAARRSVRPGFRPSGTGGSDDRARP